MTVTDKLKGLVTAAALAAATMTAAPAAADLSDILSEGTISIGVPEDFPPFGSLGASGEYEGYDVSIANMIAEAMGVELDLVPISSDQRIPYLETDRLDLVISSMGANPERAKSIWFSSAYAPFYSGAFASDDKEISSVDDLAGYSVGLTGGTLEDLALTDMVSDETEIIRFGDNAATLAAYVSGQVDVLVTGNVVAASLSESNPDLSVDTKFILRDSPCFIGIKQGNADLLRWVNVFILTNTLNGELNTLSEEWFGQPLPPLPSL
ncbi:transporter substrate-binding domain-containing protein [Palleronia pelagia]|uniref:Polar amino acid transport system substrate-binding protein n=1 Tax=Palleronia pelagia TaxID=387096 RepID=A0A1H8KLB1_9RHOB|nr:transporter substrate-binding domain-containing protein [Palleronia pelagia]SEN93665.1 polar amino acid transport system substrate-binding protein [Palleronia pelagia]